MKLFIDFDDVLFYTKKFVQDEKNIFLHHGISEEIFKKHYYSYFENSKRFYDLENQLANIKKELKIDVSELEKDVENFLQDTSDYVFQDVEIFLERFDRDELYLLSYSETDFQKLKIKNSGIYKYFKKIIITDKNKSEDILKILKEKKNRKKETIYFLDDRIIFIEEVKKAISDVKTILIKRKEGRYQDKKNKCCDFEVRNLEEVLRVVGK